MAHTIDVEARKRWRRRLTAALVAAAVISPAIRDRDSFPLSTYPVYATARERVAVLGTAVGVDEDGRRERLSMAAIGETDDPLIAESTVRNAVRAGRAQALCRAIARRVEPGLEAVEVVEETHDIVRRAAGDRSLLERQVHARCGVSP